MFPTRDPFTYTSERGDPELTESVSRTARPPAPGSGGGFPATAGGARPAIAAGSVPRDATARGASPAEWDAGLSEKFAALSPSACSTPAMAKRTDTAATRSVATSRDAAAAVWSEPRKDLPRGGAIEPVIRPP